MTGVTNTSAEVSCTFLTCLSKKSYAKGGGGKKGQFFLHPFQILPQMEATVLNIKACGIAASQEQGEENVGKSVLHLIILLFLFLLKPA